MNVEIGTEVSQFPEKENINRIFFAVCGLAKKKGKSTVWIIKKQLIIQKLLIHKEVRFHLGSNRSLYFVSANPQKQCKCEHLPVKF
jgi:hypothetical protein